MRDTPGGLSQGRGWRRPGRSTPDTVRGATQRLLVVGLSCALARSALDASPVASYYPTPRALAPSAVGNRAPSLTAARSIWAGEDAVQITGWLSLVRNGVTRYYLADDTGQIWEALIDDELISSLGGPLAVDRQRVTVSGEAQSGSSGLIRVITIQLAAP